MIRTASGVTAALVLASSTAAAAVPQHWSFQLQARSTLDPSLPGFNLPYPSSLSSQYVALDEDGGVAVRVVMGDPEGIFYGRDGVGGIVLSATGNGDPVWSPTLDLRDGMIALEDGGFDGGALVIDTSGDTVQDFPAGGPQGVSGFSAVTLTGDGALCYRADFGFLSDKVVIDEFDAGVRTQTLIADTTGDYSFLFAPEVNDARQVLMNTIPTSGPSRRIVRFEPDGSPTTVAQTGSGYNAFVNSTALAQNGDVAFSARRSAGSVWEVDRWDGTTTTTIATGDDPDINNSSLANFPPVLNSSGLVALRATDVSQNSTALWVGDGTDLVKLVEYGQMIDTDLGPIELGFDFGAGTGRQVMNGVIDINEAGQIAFAAFLRNGTIGVFVATPVADACVADLNGDGSLDFFDVSAFLSAFTAGDAAADLNGDGRFDFFDVSAFLNAFSAGCP